MNYLAHLYLSDDAPLAVVGNLMSDFIKGRDRLYHMPVDLQRGIMLHRFVDSYTDHHPVVHQCIRRISAKWGWYSGIIIDVYFDHLLAREWGRYSIVPLREYCDLTHHILRDYWDQLDDDMREMASRLIANDRLMSYYELQGIEEALRSISQLLAVRMPRHPIQLHEAIPDLIEHHDGLQHEFNDFFPQLIEFATQKNRELEPLVVAC